MSIEAEKMADYLKHGERKTSQGLLWLGVLGMIAGGEMAYNALVYSPIIDAQKREVAILREAYRSLDQKLLSLKEEEFKTRLEACLPITVMGASDLNSCMNDKQRNEWLGLYKQSIGETP